MTRKLTKLSLLFICLSLLFKISPLSLIGYYTDTLFLILTCLISAVTIGIRIKQKLNLLLTAILTILLVPNILFVYSDFDFSFWGPVQQGTVYSKQKNQEHSKFTRTTVYYRLNINEKLGPEECEQWNNEVIIFFPLFEWNNFNCVNCCCNIAELYDPVCDE